MAEKTVGAYRAQGNVIPFPIRNAAPDPSRAFVLAHCAAEVAAAAYRLSDALCWQAKVLGDPAAIEQAREAHWRQFDTWVDAIDQLAELPAQTAQQLDMKRRAIGRVWLKAEGERYDRLRAGVARDEARLKNRKIAVVT